MDIELLETLALTGALSMRTENGTVYLMIALDNVPVPVLPVAPRKHTLGTIQSAVYRSVVQLSKAGPVTCQEVYNVAHGLLVKPAASMRDRRLEKIRRALAALADKGYIAISADMVKLIS